MRRGADAYLAKPFDKEELLVRLEKLVERQKRMAAYFSRNLNQAATASGSTHSPREEALQIEDSFLRKVRHIVEKNYSDEHFALPQLCRKIGMSRSQLYRKMKAIADVSPSDFIRSYRLNQAKTLLEKGELNVSEVAWKVGYKDPAHFTRSFQEAFGTSPSDINNSLA